MQRYGSFIAKQQVWIYIEKKKYYQICIHRLKFTEQFHQTIHIKKTF